MVLHEETYLYLEDIHRVLKSTGLLVFSFLEFNMPSHWAVFQTSVAQQRNSTRPHLNMFMERTQIKTWARHLGFEIQEFIDGDMVVSKNNDFLGQAVAILKPVKNGKQA